MLVDNFSWISGVMQILGVDSDLVCQFVEGLYKMFNDLLWVCNDVVQELLVWNGVVIECFKDGMVDVYKMLDNVVKIFFKLLFQM